MLRTHPPNIINDAATARTLQYQGTASRSTFSASMVL